jgi:membrane protease YdiL (CAAX protease family)
VKAWLIMTRSGWLRHYFHTIEVLPLMLSLPIVFGQVFCEELMFRGILISYFLPAGPWVAIIASTVLFMVMQLFHLPSWLSGIFPLVGSMVIGLINGILYAKFFNLLPLVIAHFTFFIAAVL